MNPLRSALPRMAVLSMFAALPCFAGGPVSDESSADVIARFRNPPVEFKPAPLWVWNDMLDEGEVVDTLGYLASQGYGEAFVHPRPGLMTPYLGPDWFGLWKSALREAERLGLRLWIYDENSYPSGFAGGLVPETMPESRGRGIRFREVEGPPPADEPNLLGAFPMDTLADARNYAAEARQGKALPEGRWLVATLVRPGNSPWHGGRSYVDLLHPGTTRRFLDITLETYRREVGEEFGRRIPGVFSDEPQLWTAGDLPWTDDLPEAFEHRWGYSLLDRLPSLIRPIGDWKRVRHNYFQTLLDLFIERWAIPYHDYCAQHGLLWTGHYWDHEWPNCLSVPDNMALYAWMQRPGVDMLMNQYNEDPAAGEVNFGNVRIVKELASVANQLGLKRTMCETHGASGWDLRFQDMKRIQDWLYALGANAMVEHLSYVSIRGARKRDHPPSFSYHAPWWEAYHTRTAYTARLSAALSSGSQVNPLLILEPTTTAWLYQNRGARKGMPGQSDNEARHEIGKDFAQLLLDLERASLEYDLGSEQIMAAHGSARGGKLRVGQREYGMAVIPPGMENLNTTTVPLLREFLAGGGRVVCLGDPPTRRDGAEDGELAALSKRPGWTRCDMAGAIQAIRDGVNDGFSLTPDPGDQGILRHHRRRLSDGDLLFLANTSQTTVCAGAIRSSAGGAETWDIPSGVIASCPFTKSSEGIELRYKVPPVGSALYFLSKEAREPGTASPEEERTIQPGGAPEIRALSENVLPLDYVDIVSGELSLSRQYFHRANAAVMKIHGLTYNPWEEAVQFRDEEISRKFPPESGFTATYRFHIAAEVPESLFVVIERPDIYRLTLNGKPLPSDPEGWWVDKSFGKIPIHDLARKGENLLTLQASPYTVFHEIEPVYLLGDFSVAPANSGHVIAEAAPLALGSWAKQGHPFYSDRATYREKFKIDSRKGRYCVVLPDWNGSVARVAVNGDLAGYAESSGSMLDVTRWIRPGDNVVEALIIGTLRNAFGPHHGQQAAGSVWPGNFHNAPNPGPPPGAQYSVVDYGLFEPFVLKWTP